MLSLDDPQWQLLDGGYRTPYDPTPALTRLERNVEVAETWEELWGELYHQGDVGEASYAAVPQLVRIHSSDLLRDWNFYGLISVIEIERHRTANPPLPDWLSDSYQEAWAALLPLCLQDISATEDAVALRPVLGAIALAKGNLKLGALLVHSTEDEIDEILENQTSWSELYRERLGDHVVGPR